MNMNGRRLFRLCVCLQWNGDDVINTVHSRFALGRVEWTKSAKFSEERRARNDETPTRQKRIDHRLSRQQQH